MKHEHEHEHDSIGSSNVPRTKVTIEIPEVLAQDVNKMCAKFGVSRDSLYTGMIVAGLDGFLTSFVKDVFHTDDIGAERIKELMGKRLLPELPDMAGKIGDKDKDK